MQSKIQKMIQELEKIENQLLEKINKIFQNMEDKGYGKNINC